MKYSTTVREIITYLRIIEADNEPDAEVIAAALAEAGHTAPAGSVFRLESVELYHEEFPS